MIVPFKVGKYDGVEEQMRSLLDLATRAGLRDAYLDALKQMADHLENDPLNWGDPMYRKSHPVGIVCQGLVGPIIVRYAVHESANAVLIIEVKALFDWPVP